MDSDTKSILKFTLLGMLGGGTVSALHAIHNNKEESKPRGEFRENEIVVPLSRKNFMKSVRGKSSKKTGQPALPAPAEPKLLPAPADTSSMSASDLASLKRKLLLGKAASCCDRVSGTTTPESEEVGVKASDETGRQVIRDKGGRFTKVKAASILDFVPGGTAETVGLAAGGIAGFAALKLLNDRIQVNRVQRQLDRSRRRYADMVSREVNDTDAPYYSKTASDSNIKKLMGLVGTVGAGAAGLSGLVMYRIMENRRIAEDKAMDKDNGNYPVEKNIRFEFAKDKTAEDHGFFG